MFIDIFLKNRLIDLIRITQDVKYNTITLVMEKKSGSDGIHFS